MRDESWKERIERWRGGGPIEADLAAYRKVLSEVNLLGESLIGRSDEALQAQMTELKLRVRQDEPLDDYWVEVFALVREAAVRTIGLRPFDVQVLAAIALDAGKLVEMQTGEGKTLAAVLPACLNALSGKGVHILTFNDYLARRDAAWMGPVYEFLGLSVGSIQEGMDVSQRQAAYGADVTYTTAKEAGFDFLRGHLCRSPGELVQRPFHYAIVDEADSILIDEARVPLVIAGELPVSGADPFKTAELIAGFQESRDWETDENARNVHLTEHGFDRVEEALGCGDLHQEDNYLLLTEVNQALHARVLLKLDVDYIVRGGRIEVVDEFTGRVVDDRRWPDGLQAALEAKEKLEILPGGRILGSIALQHFILEYPRYCGMTATAQPSEREFSDFYGLKTVPIPPNRTCVREDLKDVVFTHREAKNKAIIREISAAQRRGRPVLVGTLSVAESEMLATDLRRAGIKPAVLNAKNDETEAEIIGQAGDVGAVTISTNMAGRGTDIKLGGAGEERRDRVAQLGGLYVIGTHRQESRRTDSQLRGRAGRQGDPGASRFFVSLEDEQLQRFGIDELIPEKLRPSRTLAPIDHPVIRKEIARLQRIIEGQNHEIRKTLSRYSEKIEEQRESIQEWRSEILCGRAETTTCAMYHPKRFDDLCDRFGIHVVDQAERTILLHHIDECWAEYLAFVAHVREGIHLVGLGGLDPLAEFHKQVSEPFQKLHETIEERTADTFAEVEITKTGIDLDKAGLKGPSSTWTYLINDRALTDLQQMLFGHGSTAIAAGAALMVWPLLLAWGVRNRFRKGGK